VKTRHSSPFLPGNLRRRAWKRGEGSLYTQTQGIAQPTHDTAGSPQPKQLKSRRRGGGRRWGKSEAWAELRRAPIPRLPAALC
jgi:hypothetical protein